MSTSVAPDDGWYDEHEPIADPRRSACLRNLGEGHWHAVVILDCDGRPWPWLLDIDHDPDDEPTSHQERGCCCKACAPHEQAGRLPVAVRVKLNQCQAMAHTKKRRCTMPAPIGEWYCTFHRGQSASDGA